MRHAEALGHENRALRDRFARLSAAILRINSSLDLATVPSGEIVDSARAPTGARESVITMIDEEGRLPDFVTSGLTPERCREMVGWPDGPWLFEHLRNPPVPIRLEDFPGYLRSLGLSNRTRSKTTCGLSLNHRGGHISHFFLGDKEDGEALTGEDEEVPMLSLPTRETSTWPGGEFHWGWS